jgi:nicotinamide mononucleotide transporter
MLYWLISLASLFGVWLNIRKHVAGFWIWAFTNATWAYVDLQHEIYPQAALQSVYFMLALYGICQWSKGHFRNRKDKSHES